MEANGVDVFVGLDLGSESMAAYFRGRVGDRFYQEMVDLQAHGDNLVGYTAWKLKDGDRPSRRLLTRIGLYDFRVKADLPHDHALLEFVPDGRKGPAVDGYGKSLYQYFFRSDEHPLGAPKLMPNPKIPFQVGADDVIPDVDASDGGTVNKDPEKLLQHMILQVLRNFVLRSPQLRDVAPARIHLTVTIPNVYSLVHLKSIQEYVEQHSGIPVVDLIYESDAVAYWVLGTDGHTAQSRQAIEQMLRDGRDAPEIRLITIDVGRGTTDMSMILLQAAVGDRPGEQEVLARTGRSDGGNRLSYLLAQHYDRQLEKAFRLYGEAVGSLKPPFLFRGLYPGVHSPTTNNRAALIALESLIAHVKRAIDEDYRVDLPDDEHRALIAAVVDEIIQVVPSYVVDPTALSVQRLRNALGHALFLPSSAGANPLAKVPEVSINTVKTVMAGAGKLWERFKSRKETASAPAESPEPPAAAIPEPAPEPGKDRNELVQLVGEIPTYAIVAGQASQFRPMAAAIRKTLMQRYQFGQQRIHFLSGPIAKEACCIGAVSFQLRRNQLRNPNALFGMYGFRNTGWVSGEAAFTPIDMQRLNRGETVEVKLNGPDVRDFIFTTRAAINPKQPPEFSDGSTANLRTLPGPRFEIRYDPLTVTLTLNGQPVDVANFGKADESIWPKVWPEKLGEIQD
ncbi:MAG: heat shock protein [Armatimonadetes bacterium]|nr:heat shock protein [Armatimonadota bacterium]